MNKKDFTIFAKNPNLVYLDSAATAQKPATVIRSLTKFYEQSNANVHRGIYQLSEQATEMFEQARNKVATFIGAGNDEIIFTSGTTQSLNMLADMLGSTLPEGSQILVTEMEHHSNLLPWQQLAQKKKVQLEYANVGTDFRLDLDDLYVKLKTHPTAILALTQMSNVLGTENPIEEIVIEVRKISPETIIVVDGAQAIAHAHINVHHLDVDFYAFSAHKLYGPLGTGILYGKRQLLQKLEPSSYGGGMIARVERQSSTWTDSPARFEAGTPNIVGAIGLGAAIDYIGSLGIEQIVDSEAELTQYFLDLVHSTPGLTLYGPDELAERGPVFSFNLKGIHAHDLAQVLGEQHVAVRAGHHCNQILMNRLGVPATLRASLGLYNDKADIDKLFDALNHAKNIFSNGSPGRLPDCV